MKAQTIIKGDYELVILKSKDKEEYRTDILKNGKYISERVYNYYIKNHKDYADKLEFKGYAILIKSNEYDKIISDIIQKFDSRDIKKEMLDNASEMLDNFEEVLNDSYNNYYIDLTEGQRADLNKTIKAAIRNYIEQL